MMRMRSSRWSFVWVALVAVALSVPAAIADNAGPAGVQQKAKRALNKAGKALRIARQLRNNPPAEGPPGEKGEKGDKGDKGDPATALWATVEADGTLVEGSGNPALTKVGVGGYFVTFNQNISDCSVLVSAGRPQDTELGAPNGFGSTAAGFGNPNRVLVQMWGVDLNDDGRPDVTDLPFHIGVFC